MGIASIILALFHSILSLRTLIIEWLLSVKRQQLYSYRKQTLSNVRSNSQMMTKLPIHLGVVIVEHDISYTDIANIILWTVAMGISYITIYDRQGTMKRNQTSLQLALRKQQTRLLGDNKLNIHVHQSTARRIQNGATGEGTVHVMLLAVEDGRQDLVNTAKQLCRGVTRKEYKCADITPNNVDSILIEKRGFPDPDLLLKFGPVDSILGFLPWQIRLTEMLSAPSHHNITYSTFHQLLDDFGKMNQRLGK